MYSPAVMRARSTRPPTELPTISGRGLCTSLGSTLVSVCNRAREGTSGELMNSRFLGGPQADLLLSLNPMTVPSLCPHSSSHFFSSVSLCLFTQRSPQAQPPLLPPIAPLCQRQIPGPSEMPPVPATGQTSNHQKRLLPCSQPEGSLSKSRRERRWDLDPWDPLKYHVHAQLSPVPHIP